MVEAGDLDGTACPESTWFGEQVDFETCKAAGGLTKDWADAMYMSIITSTTIGYGDLSPKSQWGRLFGCVWITYSVLASALFISIISESAFEWRERQKEEDKKLHESGDITHAMDKNDFLKYVLIRKGFISRELVDDIDDVFKSLDPGTGFVTKKDLLDSESPSKASILQSIPRAATGWTST